jgi:predicted HTH transcriptional regulator
MKLKENEKTELKKSTAELKDAVISIAAMLNKNHHGEIYFGVDEKKGVVGQSAGKETLRDISREISDKIEPKIFPKIEKLKIEFKGSPKTGGYWKVLR